MAGRILRDDVEALRRQADIVQVVGDYTTLKRAGRSFKGLCPFHTERTPSFHVTPGENFFHCFGCGASGDLYDFLQRIEGLDFPEAVEALARRVGFTLRYEELTAKDRRALGQRTKLVDVTRAALEFFTAQLYADEGQVARDYLKERGFGRDDAERFELGYAPNAWDTLSLTLKDEGIRPEDLIETGLSVKNDRGGLRDRFRGRLIFPIHDPGGDVIGFGGRVLPGLDYGDFDPPKYLNSAETPLYKKNRVLYGVPQARADIVRAESVLICEGYTDVMGLHQAGFGNAVATCGTAVGVEHLRAVARYAKRVVFAFDGDAAGVKAAERAWEAATELASTSGVGTALELRVLALPDGQDPADAARELGVDGMRQLVDDALPVVPFVLRHRLADADLSTEGGRTAALHEALEILQREPDADLRREWARTEVAAGIGLAYDFVARSAARQGIDLDRHQGVAATPVARRTTATTGAKLDRAQVQRERDVLRVALQHPELLPDEWEELTEDDLSHPVARAVFVTIRDAGGPDAGANAVVAAAADDDLRATIRGLAVEEEPVPIDADTAAWRVRTLVALRVEAETKRLRERLQTLHHTRDRDELMDVQRQLATLEQRRRTLTTVIDPV
ncbi:MAG: DNA primase [Nitriliruptor sp.]|uniref:DNA primase n=1 Tax=Nitriliruptor sp. TaxID=2448056 RepID=UPI0034A04CC1